MEFFIGLLGAMLGAAANFWVTIGFRKKLNEDAIVFKMQFDVAMMIMVMNEKWIAELRNSTQGLVQNALLFKEYRAHKIDFKTAFTMGKEDKKFDFDLKEREARSNYSSLILKIENLFGIESPRFHGLKTAIENLKSSIENWSKEGEALGTHETNIENACKEISKQTQLVLSDEWKKIETFYDKVDKLLASGESVTKKIQVLNTYTTDYKIKGEINSKVAISSVVEIQRSVDSGSK